MQVCVYAGVCVCMYAGLAFSVGEGDQRVNGWALRAMAAAHFLLGLL